MVYIREFDSFVAQAKTLYEQNPSKLRYSMKYRHFDEDLTTAPEF